MFLWVWHTDTYKHSKWMETVNFKMTAFSLTRSLCQMIDLTWGKTWKSSLVLTFGGIVATKKILNIIWFFFFPCSLWSSDIYDTLSTAGHYSFFTSQLFHWKINQNQKSDICNCLTRRDMTYRNVRKMILLSKLKVSMTSLWSTAAPNCRSSQSKGRYR